MMKRCLSMILALMMVLSMLPAQALATELPEIEAEEVVLETQAPTEAPEAEPATEAATEPAPATEPEAATEPAPATEPVPAETEAGQVTNEAMGEAEEGGEEVYLNFYPDVSWDYNFRLTATDGEIVTIPDHGVENPTATFEGWMLLRHNNGVDEWLTDNGSFTTDEAADAALFAPGEEFTVSAALFEEGELFKFWGVWKDHVLFDELSLPAMQLAYGETITFPAADELEISPGMEFNGWVVGRSDGAALTEGGFFSAAYETPTRYFAPDETLEITADVFDNRKYTYSIGYSMRAASDPDDTNETVLLIFVPDAADGDGNGMEVSDGETITIPDHGLEEAIGTFEGWVLMRNDGAWLTDNGSFTKDGSADAVLFKPGESFTVSAALLEEGSYFKFMGVWKDLVMFTLTSLPSMRIAYGKTFTFPTEVEDDPGSKLLGWSLKRSDGAYLTVGGFFSDTYEYQDRYFTPGETLEVTADLFDYQKYTYTFCATWASLVVYFNFDPDGTEAHRFGYAASRELEIPGHGIEDPDFEFEGWMLLQDDTAWYTDDGAFTKDPATTPRIFTEGEILALGEEFDNDNHWYTLYGVWEDAVTFRFMDGSEAQTVALNGAVTVPECQEQEEGLVFEAWFLGRSDGARLMEDGSFSTDYNKTFKLYQPGDTQTVTAELFDPGKYFYYFSARYLPDGEDPTPDDPMTEEQLRELLQTEGYADITSDITLTEDLIIPKDSYLFLMSGATLTVPAGVKLDVQGGLYILDGTLLVESGGILRAGSTYAIQLMEGAKLEATDADVSGVKPGSVAAVYGTQVSGISESLQILYYPVRGMEDLKTAAAFAEVYDTVNANSTESFTISEDLTLPDNLNFTIEPNDDNETPTYTTVTVAEDKLLYFGGAVEVACGCALVISEGAELYSPYGDIWVYEAFVEHPAGRLTNNGTVRIGLDGLYAEGAIVDGSGEIIYIAELYEVANLNNVQTLYNKGVREIAVYYSDITIAKNLQLPDDLKLIFVDCDINIKSGYTLSGGKLELWESRLRINGKYKCTELQLWDCSVIYLSGTYKGADAILDSTSSVEPESKIARVEEVDGLRYVKLDRPLTESLALVNSDAETVSGTTVAVDMFEQPTYQLTCAVEPEYASEEVTWKSSAATVATVDENGLVTFKKPGTVTITATAKDGSKKTASVKFTVTYLDSATKITASADVPSIGLQTGYIAWVTVTGAGEIDPAMLDYTSSNEAIATVDEYGCIIAGEKTGTATVTAAIKGDPLKRKATVSVKVIALQTEDLLLNFDTEAFENAEIVEDENGEVTQLNLDAEVLTTENKTFHIDYAAIGYEFAVPVYGARSGGSAVELDPGIKWTSSDTRIATVTPDDTGATVTLKADGVVTITATTTDLAKAEKSLTVAVRDYSPRLAATSLTLNSYFMDGVNVGLVESYGKKIAENGIALYEYDTQSKTYLDEESGRLVTAYDAEAGILTVMPAEGAELKNGTLKLLMKVTLEDTKVYDYYITLKVANTLPSVTVKQASKINLFYTDSYAVLNVTAKNAKIESVTMEDTDAFSLAYDAETGECIILNENVAGKPDTSATLTVELEGYSKPVVKTLTIATVTTKPSLVLTPASSTVSTYRDDIDPTTSFMIKNKSTGEILDLREAGVDTLVTDIATCEVLSDYQTVQLTLRGEKGGTSTVYVQYPNWKEPMKLTHKITVKSVLPTPSLSASTVKLNSVLPGVVAETTVKLNQSNWEIANVLVTATGKAAAVAQADKIGWDYDPDTAVLTASFLDENDLPKTGTYTFNYVVVLKDAETEAEMTRLPAKSVKVTVSATAPTVKLGGTLKLNKLYGNDAMAETAVTVTNSGDYTLVDLVPKTENEVFSLEYIPEIGVLRAQMLVDEAVNKKYTVELVPVLKQEESEPVYLSKTIKATVEIYSGKPSITVTSKGKLDTVNPDSEIVYTISKITNLPGNLWDVEPLGDDAELFDIDPIMIGEKYGISLIRKDGAVLATNKTYKLQFNIYTVWNDENGEQCTYSVPVNISFKVSQSSLKFAKIPTLNLYQSNDRLSFTVDLTSPAGARLLADGFKLNSKTAAQFRKAVGNSDPTVEISLDGRSARITFEIENPGYLSYGKSYSVLLDVTPEGNATNVKPTQLKLTVKVSK